MSEPAQPAGVGRLLRILEKPTQRVIGLMSGTSVDAIDAALVEIDSPAPATRVALRAFASLPFPPEIRRRLFHLFDPAHGRVDEICSLDFLMGEVFAEAALRLLRDAELDRAEVDLIGAAGQTLWHDPERITLDPAVPWIDRPLVTRSTFAIGQSAVIAERTGIVTVGDLRVRDVAAGGHGAPLVAYADWALLRDGRLGRCVQNIGGIGNVTYLPPGCGIEDVIAFDTGPGNMVIDALAEVISAGAASFDRDGGMAARGTVREPLLAEWLDDPYFAAPPPKTTGRERFGVQFARRAIRSAQADGIGLEDLIATATELTARTIADAYRRFVLPRGPIDQIIVGGGGSLNRHLMSRIEALLPGIPLLRHEDVGIDSRAKEAIAIALIARDSVAGLPTNVPGATGGSPAILGKISL